MKARLAQAPNNGAITSVARMLCRVAGSVGNVGQIIKWRRGDGLDGGGGALGSSPSPLLIQIASHFVHRLVRIAVDFGRS